MSMTRSNRNNLRNIRRRASGQLFGMFMLKARESRGFSVEEVAERMGIEASDWLAIEAGAIPHPEWLPVIADGLDIGLDQIGVSIRICRDAWDL